MSRTNERGQAVVLMVISLAVLTGMAALVLDVGIWMRTDRRLQATADAAALAGAQKLPTDVAGAKALAQTYANQNGGDVLGANISVTTTYTSNDTISVRAAKTQSGIFSKIGDPLRQTVNHSASHDDTGEEADELGKLVS